MRRDLTAGDLARLLHVDLKTIHNWVNQGHVFARRTEGRHLRFQRVEVVRFLRRFGYPVPPELGMAPAKIFVHGAPSTIRVPSAEQHDGRDLFGTVLELAGGAYEVLVLPLDSQDPRITRDLVRALRARPETRSVCMVGVSRKPARRAEFVGSGGDLALAPDRPSDVAHAVRFLIGGVAVPPRGAVTG